MRKYLDWEVADATLQQTYLQYPTTWLLGGDQKNVEMETVGEYAKTCDFIIMQEVPFEPLEDILDTRKCCVFALGSLARRNLGQLLKAQVELGLKVVAPISDPTISGHLLGTPFENIMVNLPALSRLTGGVKKNAKITVITAQTNPALKGVETMEKVMKEFPEVDFLHIKGMDWEQHQVAKAKAHIMLDSLGDSSYGLNCLEALYARQEVISNITPWCYALHPDLPIRSINKAITGKDMEDSIRMQVRAAIDYVEKDPETPPVESWDYVDWVRRHFAPSVVVQKWKWYIKHVMED